MQRTQALFIFQILHQRYDDGSPRHFLRFENPYQILVLTILSAQTTDRQVNEIAPRLFEEYPGPEDLARADPATLEAIIRPTGFYHAKARHLIGAAGTIARDFDGKVPKTLEELVTLPGVGRKTANIVLHHAFGIDEGVAVDTHVRRTSRRIGFSDHADPDRIEEDLRALFPKECWGDLNYLLIRHGRETCTARNPKCEECAIRDCCRYYREVVSGEKERITREEEP